LANYFNLSDAQVSAIQNAILENQNLAGGESAQIQELQYAIQTLEAAQTIDTATLGADYVQIAQIQAAEATQTTQLIATVRSVLTDPQQPLLAALDNAMSLSQIEGEAVSFSILALPSSLGQTYTFFNFGGFPIGTVY
jgi:cytochrome c551/c552